MQFENCAYMTASEALHWIAYREHKTQRDIEKDWGKYPKDSEGWELYRYCLRKHEKQGNWAAESLPSSITLDDSIRATKELIEAAQKQGMTWRELRRDVVLHARQIQVWRRDYDKAGTALLAALARGQSGLLLYGMKYEKGCCTDWKRAPIDAGHYVHDGMFFRISDNSLACACPYEIPEWHSLKIEGDKVRELWAVPASKPPATAATHAICLPDVPYNFEPDYAKWWKKKTLTAEQLCWLYLAVNPDDWDKFVLLCGDNAKKDADATWYYAFERWLHQEHQYYALHDFHKLIMDMVDTANLRQADRKQVINFLYVYRREFPPAFAQLLRDKELMPTHFDHYKNHDQYRCNVRHWIDKGITTEMEAQAVMFGLEPQWLAKYLALPTWSDADGEGKFFIRQYHLFIDTHMVDETRTFLATLRKWNKQGGRAKALQCSFREYVQQRYDDGDIPHDEVIAALDLQYSPQGKVYQHYVDWIRKGAWTLSEAARLILGEYDKDVDNQLLNRWQEKRFAVLACDDDNYSYWNDTKQNWELLKPIVENHIANGSLKASTVSRGQVFKPNDIIQWLVCYVPAYKPPRILVQLLGADILSTHNPLLTLPPPTSAPPQVDAVCTGKADIAPTRAQRRATKDDIRQIVRAIYAAAPAGKKPNRIRADKLIRRAVREKGWLPASKTTHGDPITIILDEVEFASQRNLAGKRITK